MAARSIGSMFRLSWSSAAIAVLLTSSGWSAEPRQDATVPDASSAALVRSALEKEITGDNVQREALLRQALSESPKDAAAHWQLGEVRVQDKWQSTANIETASRYDKRLAEFARRRDAAGPNAADQIALARWCRKNRLDDQQRAHWLLALQIEPDNAEAIRALGLRAYHGTLATPEQIRKLTANMHRVSRAVDRWRPRVAQWLGVIQRNSGLMPADFRDDLSKISDSCEMLGLERALWLEVGAKGKKQEFHRMVLTTVLAMSENPYSAAAESLVRAVVFSQFNDVRTAAATALKKHPLDHYVPLLLSGLQAPIEADMRCHLSAAGDLITSYSVFQEGALNNVSASLLLCPVYPGMGPALVSVAPGTGTVKYDYDTPQWKQYMMRTEPLAVASATAEARADLAAAPGEARQANAQNAAASEANRRVNAEKAKSQAARQEAALREAVDRVNRASAQRNAKIEAALCATTGLDLGDQPTKWWTWWWQDYNESYNLTGGTDQSDENPPAKPETRYEGYVEYQGSVPTYPTISTVGSGPTRPCSCFAPGTKVWTLTGPQPIEKVKVGDCVLAQDVESGELAYKPVLAVTVREPGLRMRVGLGSESIIATPSHPFWVLGQGWRMTKQLEVGNRVHTPSGGVTIESIEKLDPDPAHATGMAHNLIVADFDSYFVGERGVLVHDNTPRIPTAVPVPGLLRSAPLPASDEGSGEPISSK